MNTNTSAYKNKNLESSNSKTIKANVQSISIKNK